MSFTDKEKKEWLEERRQRSTSATVEVDMTSGSNTCLHCGNAFSGGTVTEDAAICDTCNY